MEEQKVQKLTEKIADLERRAARDNRRITIVKTGHSEVEAALERVRARTILTCAPVLSWQKHQPHFSRS